jgi:D-alanyl-D-alanine carboxypeptidase/D-alanyl-D-alanine-endopeptidase (penicillin-binding protein 4)
MRPDPGSLLAALALLCAALPARADDLADKIKDVITGPDYKSARWGVLVVDAASGKAVYEHNPDQLFAPASVTKLYSCATALIELGADHRFETPVFLRGKHDKDKGKLHGDLILRASGDFNLGGRSDKSGKLLFTDGDHIYASPGSRDTAVTDSDPLAGLKDLAKQVKASGVRELTGDVLIDDRLFPRSSGSGSGPRIVTPIVVNDNLVDVIVRPSAKTGDKASVELRPETPFVQIDALVDTVAKGERLSITTRRVGANRFVVRGQIPSDVKQAVRVCAVDDPAGFARALFIEALRAEGVKVRASSLEAPTAELPQKDGYDKLTRVALFRSAPLSEAIKVILKVSHNLHASALPQLVALKHGQNSQPAGMRVQGRVLGKLGVDVKSISLESGAGGGDGDRVSPRTTVQLLQAMRKRDDWATFEAALPVLGVDGTLATVVGKDSPARGKVKGKTGTYTDENRLQGRIHLRAKSLGGVMTSAKGKTLVFTIFVNDVVLPLGVTATREGKTIGKLCELIYQHAP